MSRRHVRLVDWTLRLTARVVEATERATLRDALLTFVFAVTLRNAVELFSNDTRLPVDRMIHYWLFYVSVALSIALVFRYVVGTPFAKASKTVLVSYIVVVVAPVVDLVWTGGEGTRISYFLPGRHDDYIVRFVTFFGAYDGLGASPGIRVEIGAILVGCVLYGLARGAGFGRALLAALLVYTSVFIHAAAPLLLNSTLPVFGVEYEYGDVLLARFFCLSSVVFGVLAARAHAPRYFVVFVRDLRWLRVAFYELLFVLGYLFDLRSVPFDLSADDVYDPVLVALGLLSAILFAIVTNNLEDRRIDAVTNPGRPLFARGIEAEAYARTAVPFLLLAVFIGMLVRPIALLSMLLFCGLYYLYSVPPLRIKRLTLLSKLVIGANALNVFLLGWHLRGGDLADVPGVVFAFFLVGISLVANFIDIKDVEGDRAAGIRTLPVWIGERPAQIVCGLAYLGLFVALGAVVGDPQLLVAAGVSGLIGAGLMVRPCYRERPVFVLLDLSIFAFLLYVLYLAPFDSLEQVASWHRR
jgi:4-hydroxybenzoate polyprenyltransferase